MGSTQVIILDTHAWIWWVTESASLSKSARKAAHEAELLGVSIISCWEVAMLVAKGRIGFSIDVKSWLNKALARPKVKLLDLDVDIVTEATRLSEGFHGDPADRLIVATCLKYGVPLITKDEKIRAWKQMGTIW